MNLTNKQWLAIVMVVLGALATGGAQLTDIIGPGPTKIVVSLAGFANSILGAIMAVITGQAAIVREVQEMPGVDEIRVNTRANSALATLATSPNERKVIPQPGTEPMLERIAHGAG